MKHSICNIQLLPKAADLRKKAFDEFRPNTVIVSRNAMKSWLTSSSIPDRRSQGLESFYSVTPEAEARRPEGTTGTDHKKSNGFFLF